MSILGQSLLLWNPSKESHELTSIANTKTENVLSIAEVLELLEHTLVELDDSSPAFTTIEDIDKGETTYEDNTTELVKCDRTFVQANL